MQYAKELGLDIERFNKDLASAEVKKRIDEDVNEVARLGSTGTPAFYVNGRYVRGARSSDLGLTPASQVLVFSRHSLLAQIT